MPDAAGRPLVGRGPEPAHRAHRRLARRRSAAAVLPQAARVPPRRGRRQRAAGERLADPHPRGQPARRADGLRPLAHHRAVPRGPPQLPPRERQHDPHVALPGGSPPVRALRRARHVPVRPAPDLLDRVPAGQQGASHRPLRAVPSRSHCRDGTARSAPSIGHRLGPRERERMELGLRGSSATSPTSSTPPGRRSSRSTSTRSSTGSGWKRRARGPTGSSCAATTTPASSAAGPKTSSASRRSTSPVICDEYIPIIEACQRWPHEAFILPVDPGVRDYWVTAIKPFMKELFATRSCIGGMVWSGVDDLFAIPLDLKIGEGAVVAPAAARVRAAARPVPHRRPHLLPRRWRMGPHRRLGPARAPSCGTCRRCTRRSRSTSRRSMPTASR